MPPRVRRRLRLRLRAGRSPDFSPEEELASEPPFWLATLLFALFVLARLAHTFAYATAQNHEVRATFYSIGSVIVAIMAVWVLIVALL